MNPFDQHACVLKNLQRVAYDCRFAGQEAQGSSISVVWASLSDVLKLTSELQATFSTASWLMRRVWVIRENGPRVEVVTCRDTLH